MNTCKKHNLPFDEMGYCQPPEGELSCSGWKQMQDRISELETALSAILDDAESGDNFALDAWYCVVRSELLDAAEQALKGESHDT